MKWLSVLLVALCLVTEPTFAHVMALADGCKNPDWKTLETSVVSITMLYDTPNKEGAIGQRGTAWFITPTKLVTVSHVTDDVLTNNWRTVTISYGTTVRGVVETEFDLEARLSATLKTGLSESISIIEIKAPLAGFHPAVTRLRPLKKNEPVVGVGYRGPEKTLEYAYGHYSPLEPSDGEPDPKAKPPEPFLYFELTNEKGEDRYVFDHGASGSPIFDCKGYVVGMVSDIIIQTLPGFPEMKNGVFVTPLQPFRTTTAWGTENYTAVPTDQIPHD